MGILDRFKISKIVTAEERKLAQWCYYHKDAAEGNVAFFTYANSWFGPYAKFPIELEYKQALADCSNEEETIATLSRYRYKETERELREQTCLYQKAPEESRLALDRSNADAELAARTEGSAEYDDLLFSHGRGLLQAEHDYYEELSHCSTDAEVFSTFERFERWQTDQAIQEISNEYSVDSNRSFLARELKSAHDCVRKLENSRRTIEAIINQISSGQSLIYKKCLVVPSSTKFYNIGGRAYNSFESKGDVDTAISSLSKIKNLENKLDGLAPREKEIIYANDKILDEFGTIAKYDLDLNGSYYLYKVDIFETYVMRNQEM